MNLDKRLDKILESIVEGWREWAVDQLQGTSFYYNELATINRQISETKQAIKQLIEEEKIKELKRLKNIDCFNESYTLDKRCSNHIDIRIKELENK